MTIEERFKKLLEIACDNGYVHNKMTIDIDKDLNNLILNTNFFECLFKNVLGTSFSEIYHELYEKYEIVDVVKHSDISLIQSLKFKWVLEVEKGNALEWLFKQFGI